MERRNRVIVIGGGAAGMMAAYSAALAGGDVILAERNDKLGRKLGITGKGRCNLTNCCPPEEALQNIPRNPKFLYSAMEQFPPEEVMSFFEGLGVPLKEERGSRVFPVSDRAGDVVSALVRALGRAGVKILRQRVIALVRKDGALQGVKLENGEKIPGDRIVLATGGLSYPQTGSTGDGYTMAKTAGHTLIPPRASLVALEAEGEDCAAMQGLSLKNVAIRVYHRNHKVVYRDFGELLFTHFGLSGPVILSASAHMRDYDKGPYTVSIDLKPALDEQKLDARLLRDFAAQSNRHFSNALGGLLPRMMIPVVIARTGIPPETWVHDLTRAQRRTLLDTLKSFDVVIRGARPVEEAIVTSGGVKVSEVNPSTMASKCAPGLYLAGEILDVDGYTGGFNLQIAWCTGRLAGIHAATDPIPGQEISREM